MNLEDYLSRYDHTAVFDEEQVNTITQLRKGAMDYAKVIFALCPDSRQRERAFDWLDVALRDAIQSVIRPAK